MALSLKRKKSYGKMQLTQSTAALTLWPFLTKQTDFKPIVHFYLPMLRRGPAHSLAIAMEAPESK